MPVKRAVHTEHMIYENTISNWPEGLRIFRAPTVHDGSGTHKRMPHEITREEVKVGDILIAIGIVEFGDGAFAIPSFEIWHVKALGIGNEFDIEYNPIVRSGDYGEQVYDSLAGLLGLPPSPGPQPKDD